jgi:hypothetical protein
MRYAGNPVSESTPCETVRKVRIDPKVRPRGCTERREESIFAILCGTHPHTLLTLPLLFISRS